MGNPSCGATIGPPVTLSTARYGVLSEVGTMWYNLRGPSQDTAIWHTFIGMPNLRGAQVGLPEVGDAGGAWLMFAGTPEAHIMLPGR